MKEPSVSHQEAQQGEKNTALISDDLDKALQAIYASLQQGDCFSTLAPKITSRTIGMIGQELPEKYIVDEGFTHCHGDDPSTEEIVRASHYIEGRLYKVVTTFTVTRYL